MSARNSALSPRNGGQTGTTRLPADHPLRSCEIRPVFYRLAGLPEAFLSRLRLRPARSIAATLQAWCQRELAVWSRNGRIPVSKDALQALNATRPWTFLFCVGPDGATVLPKPAAIDTGGESARRRVEYYQRFLDGAARKAQLPEAITIAVDLNDDPMASADVPVFAFQKVDGSNNVLIPDVDFLLAADNALPSWLTADHVPWWSKRTSAVFAGSTTGGPITADVVRDMALPRLRAGVFFQDKPGVLFRLTNLVGCDTPETEAMLHRLGFGAQRMSWRAQFRHRLIISMDGNGATCSRVAITLRSRSVLLKYASNRQLYYFYGLIPWRHYVPIDTDEDVLNVLSLAREEPALFRRISAAGQQFARSFLTRQAVEDYMATLLRVYAGMLSDAPEPRPADTGHVAAPNAHA